MPELENEMNFARLVLGCIGADVRDQVFVGKLLTRSVRCTSPIAFFSKNISPQNVAFQYLLKCKKFAFSNYAAMFTEM